MGTVSLSTADLIRAIDPQLDPASVRHISFGETNVRLEIATNGYTQATQTLQATDQFGSSDEIHFAPQTEVTQTRRYDIVPRYGPN